ncbi:MAG: hypothetical protein KAT15_08795 [Bacteroidales bacterium]|nr:hypothetical protein [Bacteroidales bacterium]
MKRKNLVKTNLEARFRNEKIEGKKMNFLVGGDDNGGQGDDGGPWNP